MFTDTHCHITKEDYADIDEIIQNARNNGINKMFNNGVDIKSNIEVLVLSEKHKELYPCIGIHPEFANSYDPKDIEYIEDHIDKIIAIGEIGLDYHYEQLDKEKQKELLEAQLKIAEKYNKKVIIHSREATEDTINTLKKYSIIKGVIHCFSGSLETAKIYIKMGYKIGVGGVLTFKNSKLKDVIKELPIESIILETDSPYLSPEPFRGEKNEPARVRIVAEKLAEIKGIDIKKVSEITEKNVKEFFDI